MAPGEHQCVGCGKDHPSNKSLASHRSKCRLFKTRHTRNVGADIASSSTLPPTENEPPMPLEPDDHGGDHEVQDREVERDLNNPSSHLNLKPDSRSVPPMRQPRAFVDEPMSAVPDIATLELMETSPVFHSHSEPQGAATSAGAHSPKQKQPVAQTKPNRFGVYRVYKHGRPSLMPNESRTLNSRALIKSQLPAGGAMQALSDVNSATSPFRNKSIELLMSWHYSSSRIKSFGTLNSLVQDVILNPEFNAADLNGFDAAKQASILDNFTPPHPRSVLSPDDGWIESYVPIRLPPPGRGEWGQEADAPVYNVKGFFYRKPLEVIKAALQEEAAARFNFTPFEEYWKPSADATPERIFSEIYNSDAFLQEDAKIRAQPRSDCSLETVVVPLVLYSDSTHLASFGTASLWPVYLYLGNQSKYERGKPGAFAAHHLAYIPKLDDMIQDTYRAIFDGESATKEVLTHLRRELMQGVWEKLLDDDLMDAYLNGIVIEFCEDPTMPVVGNRRNRTSPRHVTACPKPRLMR
ncbi:hypothetical protein D9613_012409 [Agrocybe pediades]|uniref:Uncharacterized protein n=1 Tax=Agrocybe pediades TaxID=84607 RepID=A0A8H4QRC1_9AGAR|nr:hypothetical protein D9613_012409 [Agrocybe pediades]